MVVHFLGKEKVVGSIPALGSITECSSVWPERLLWEQNVGGSNPSTPTIFGPLAQLVRASGPYPDGCRIVPYRVHQKDFNGPIVQR